MKELPNLIVFVVAVAAPWAVAIVGYQWAVERWGMGMGLLAGCVFMAALLCTLAATFRVFHRHI